jgi:hypothetical protein
MQVDCPRHLSFEDLPGGGKSPQEGLRVQPTVSLPFGAKARTNSPKLGEQSENVYENKGPGRKLGESRGWKAGISVVGCENEVRWQRRAGLQLIDTRQSTFRFSKLGEQSENVYENKGTL